MRARISFAALIGTVLLGSTLTAIAQTGEFAGQVPSSVIRDAWRLQDQLQRARSGVPANSVERTYGTSYPVKPPGNVTTTNRARTRE